MTEVEATTRVCPECGSPAGAQPFCGTCGRNLSREERLPTRQEWAQRKSTQEADGQSAPPKQPPPPSSSAVSPPQTAIAPSLPRWLVPLGFVVLGLAVLLGVLAWPFLLLAVASFVLGIVLAVQRRVAPGVTLIVLSLLLPIAGVIFIKAFIVKPYRIPSGSMEPTLAIGQRVIVDRVSRHFTSFHRGDIVVFHPPKGADSEVQCGEPNKPPGEPCPKATPQKSSTNFIKRIVGVPGDRLSVRAGRAYIDGKELKEPYIRPDATCPICNEPRPITIPPGHFFMIGDNRGESDDSRDWGPVPKRWIIGAVLVRYAPLSKLKLF
jgi:signal peptidase I